MTDPIADMLSQIRNAIMINKSEVRLPHSNLKQDVAKILQASGFLKDVTTEKNDDRKLLVILINEPDESPAITAIKRLSRPGRRHYVKSNQTPVVKRGRGIILISTSKGLMTGQQAKAKGLGGELICEVY